MKRKRALRRLEGYRRQVGTCWTRDAFTQTQVKIDTLVLFATQKKTSLRGIVFLCRTTRAASVRALPYLERGYDVAMYDGRGEGGSDAAPHWQEQALLDEALQVFTHMVAKTTSAPGRRIYVAGYCHGCASATYIARHTNVRDVRLILVGAFPDVRAAVRQHVSAWLFADWMVPVRLETAAHLRCTRATHIDLIHGEHDELMPVSFTRDILYEAASQCSSAKTRVHIVTERATHNHLPKTSAFARVLDRVLILQPNQAPSE